MDPTTAQRTKKRTTETSAERFPKYSRKKVAGEWAGVLRLVPK